MMNKAMVVEMIMNNEWTKEVILPMASSFISELIINQYGGSAEKWEVVVEMSRGNAYSYIITKEALINTLKADSIGKAYNTYIKRVFEGEKIA